MTKHIIKHRDIEKIDSNIYKLGNSMNRRCSIKTIVVTPKEKIPKQVKTKNIDNIGVYAIECIESKSVYIGQSKNIPIRLRQHKHALDHNKYSSKYKEWQREYSFYGEKSFTFNELQKCGENDLLYYETVMIAQYANKGYNIYNKQLVTDNITVFNCSRDYVHIFKKLVSLLDNGSITISQLEEGLMQF